MGGAPLAAPDPRAHDAIYEQLLASDPTADCIYLHSIRVGSFAWDHLQSSTYLPRHFLPYLPRGIGAFRSLTLPETFDAYLQGQFRSKKRYNLTRQLRQLSDAAGELHCVRIDTPEQVAHVVRRRVAGVCRARGNAR